MSAPDKAALDRQRTAQLLKQMQARLARAEQRQFEPIAIVGIGCRFPGGADTPEAFWQQLESAVDAVSEVPAERWDAQAFYDPDPQAPGCMNTRWGGFIDAVDRFDPGFFGIAPREAVSMDPQQRLVLETAWRALEHAGIAADRLSGSSTGVFLGVCTSDYARLGDASGARGSLDTYSGTGGSIGVTAGRLSYSLGLLGPSLVVDTACSSSLVAIHLAVASLRCGESKLAIAGGVNLVLIPDGTITLSKLQMMAPDGRCKAFDAAADGFVRGEGCGLVVLQRLSDAQAQGANILGLIAGSAVNQDGRSSGLTAPSGKAQERAIRAALANARRQPQQLAYIEAHGTGTALGDPIELDALQAVFGPQRETPLLVGSVKSNIGHLEAAAGVAGLIKAVGVLQRRRVPATLHFGRLNPNVAGGAPALRVADGKTTLAETGELLAGVSSFGFSGTNAHLVLQSAPALPASDAVPAGRAEVFVLSGRSARAVQQMAAELAAQPFDALADLAFTLATGRSRFDWRIALAARSADELRLQLATAVPRRAERQRLLLVAAAGAPPARLAELGQRLADAGLAWEGVLAGDAAAREALAGEAEVLQLAGNDADARSLAQRAGFTASIELDGAADRADADLLDALIDAPQRYRLAADADDVALAQLVADLFTAGADIDWTQRYRNDRRRRVPAPGHPFDRQRYWRDRDGVRTRREHPLLGQRSRLDDGMVRFVRSLADDVGGDFNQHRVAGEVWVSAAAQLELALAASRQLGWGESLRDVVFESPLRLGSVAELSVDCRADRVQICSRSELEGPTTCHLSARFDSAFTLPPASLPGEAEAVTPAALYQWLADGGIDYGPDYRRIRAAERSGEVARVRLGGLDPGPHLIAPAQLDAALQALGVVSFAQPGAMRVPAGCERVWLSRQPAAGDLQVSVRLRDGAARIEADIEARDADGRSVLALQGLHLAGSGLDRKPADLLFERTWPARPLRRDPAALVDALQGQLLKCIEARGLGELGELGAAMDTLALDLFRRALEQVAPAEREPRHARLVDLWQARLAAADAARPPVDAAALRERFPQNQGEIDLLLRCGEALPAVLRGQCDALELIFSGGDQGGIYADPPVSRLLNEAAAEAVLAALPEDGPVRILEVGGGTGATTRALLARLPPERIAHYCFTDVGSSLLQRARSAFADCPGFDTRRFDLDADPQAQGIGAGFDIVLAANVLHATRELAPCLARLRGLLRAGGALVALEGAGEQGWIDLVFGMTPGWWAFTDADARDGHPMPARAGWQRLLQQAGFEATLSQPDPAGLLARQCLIVARPRTPPRWTLAADAEDFAQALAHALDCRQADFDPPAEPDAADDGLLLLAPKRDGVELPDSAQIAAALDRLRRAALGRLAQTRQLVLLTRGAFDGDVLAAAAWGLGRAIAAEYPALRLRSIDLDADGDWPALFQALRTELGGDDGEDQIRLGISGRRVARLMPLPAAPRPRPALDPQGIHLITGGFGGLGLAAAVRLLQLGARRLLLVGRSPPSAEVGAHIESLRAGGVELACEVADVGCRDAMAAVLARQPGRLAGVLHCAGVLDDRALTGMNADSFAALLRPKLDACLALEPYAAELDYCVLFSSAVSLVGVAGQANHVAANAALDAFAEHRRRAGRTAISLAFAAWSRIGSARSEALAARLRDGGLDSLSPNEGLAVLEWALGGQGPSPTAVLPLDRQRLGSAEARPLPPLFRALARTAARPAPARKANSTAPALAAPTPAAVAGGIDLATVLREAAAVLAAEGAQAIDARSSLFAQGMDSLMAVELRNRLQGLLGRSLPSTLLFDHPSPLQLARALGAVEAAAAQSAAAPRPENDAIAIVGMACRFPAGANDTGAFWRLLCEGYDAVRPWPEDRPDPPGGRPGPAAYIDDVAGFDAAFFRISPREADSMDPQQRLLLESAWHALEDAGIAPALLAGSATATYVGLCNQDYAQIAAASGGIDAWSGTGGAPSVAAGRIAFALGLEGPALVVDTACSSSLVAVHLAARALAEGECDLALAAAANLILARSTTQALGALNMLASDGRCKAFDARADGFGRGEGVACVVLKRLADAQRDGDRVLALLRASAINQDGRSSSLTAPSGRAQVALIRRALQRAGLAPEAIDYIEAHGTGTALGDPIEIHALQEVFADPETPRPALLVGAVKSNLAHLEAAAGMAGLIKTVLAMNAGQVPPNAHFESLNPHIAALPERIEFPRSCQPWPDRTGASRRAGVSSFGFSGTNAHLVLEQAPPARSLPAAGTDSVLLLVSAASATACRGLAHAVAERLRGVDQDELAAVADALLARRSQLHWRIAVCAADSAQAITALLQAEPTEVPADGADLTISAAGGPAPAAQSFLAGDGLRPEREATPWVALPAYPFERARHWFTPAPSANPGPARDAAHPLLGSRMAAAAGVRYLAQISASAPAWLDAHRVGGRAVLPAAASIELMLAAAARRPLQLDAIRFEQLLDLDAPVSLRTTVEGGQVLIESATVAGAAWRRLASARIEAVAPASPPTLACDAGQTLDVERFLDGFQRQGIVYGPAFRVLKALQAGDGVARAQLRLDPALRDEPFCLHPTLLDGAFQSVAAAAASLAPERQDYRPVAIERFILHPGNGPDELVACSRVRLDPDGDLLADIDLRTPQDAPVAWVEGLRLRPLQAARQARAQRYRIDWQPVAADALALESGSAICIEVARGSAAQAAVAELLRHIQAALLEPSPPRLLVLTEGAECLPGEAHEADLAGAAARGLVATLMLEHPELRALALDRLPGEVPLHAPWPALSGLHLWRGGEVLERRLLVQGEPVDAERALARPASGRLQDLVWRARPASRPGPGEVAISVVAAGLNFRDLLNVLKQYPGDAGELGGECAGFVDAVGEGVQGLLPGMPVMAIAPGCHASHCLARAELTWPLPAGWSLQQAAVAPTVYLSAAALREVAGIGPHSRVLVHAATGGVGMAAMALARAAGARIFATAGSQAKRAWLRQQGVAGVADSRSASFLDDLKAASDGGVDVVLNSLNGELIQPGFDLLRPGGCFLELGKVEVWDEARAAAYRPDVRYHRIALDAQIVAQPQQVAADWRSLAAEIETGLLPPLPVLGFAFEQAGEAFRCMQEARHMGRIALHREPLGAGCFVVTGASGALGQAMTQRLVELGTRRLLLVSRRANAIDTELLQRLERMGASLQCRSLDLAVAGAGEALIAELDEPISGVLHAAGELADGVLATLQPEQLQRAFAAKLEAAVEIEHALRAHPEALLLLVGSAAGRFGSAGQGAYAAANAALAALAARRRGAGMPALTIDWGAWNAGMASRRAGAAMSVDAALAAFESALAGDATELVVLPASEAPAEPAAAPSPSAALLRRLAEASAGERLRLLRQLVLETVADDMRIDPARLSITRPLDDYGLDSLLAVQLRNSLSALLGQPLPSALLYDHPSIQALAEYLVQRLSLAPVTAPAEPPAPPRPAPSAPAPDPGDVDPAALLLEELERAGY